MPYIPICERKKEQRPLSSWAQQQYQLPVSIYHPFFMLLLHNQTKPDSIDLQVREREPTSTFGFLTEIYCTHEAQPEFNGA